MSSEPTQPAACHVHYPHPANVPPNTRIVQCGLPAGHPGEHEEADTEVTWIDPPAPQYAQGGVIPRCRVKRTNGIAVSQCTLRVGHEGAHLSYWSSDDPDVLVDTLPDEETPASPLSATVSASEPSTVVREGSDGQRGSEDGSGGAA